MATTKANVQIWDNVTLVAAVGDTTSSSVPLTDGYGAGALLKITNGATGPTIAAQIKIEVSGDDTKWYELGTWVGSTVNSAVSSWRVPLGIDVMYVRGVGGSNTGQNVTVDLDITEVTANA